MTIPSLLQGKVLIRDRKRVDDYLPARRGLTLFAIITVVLLVVTIVNASWCTMNFGKGLKPHVTHRKLVNPEDKQYAHSGTGYDGQMPLGRVTTRMTID